MSSVTFLGTGHLQLVATLFFRLKDVDNSAKFWVTHLGWATQTATVMLPFSHLSEMYCVVIFCHGLRFVALLLCGLVACPDSDEAYVTIPV